MILNHSARSFLSLLFIVTFNLILSQILSGKAHAWGVLAPATTHQHIMKEAYRFLQADPAFKPDQFPRLEEMMKFEGVYWGEVEYTGKGYGLMPDIRLINGPGPDAKGNSPFSWHYYNPASGEGGAPDAVRRHYRYLAEGMLTGKKEVLPKVAAWSAHFLADMHCPYHVNGASLETAKKIKGQALERYKGTQYEGAVYLTDDVKGSVKLSYLTPMKFLSNDFRTEIDRFLEIGEDWFDPWYYNGDLGLKTETSSHIAWETVVNPAAYDLAGYSQQWKNGKKDFLHPVDSQGDRTAELAKSAAASTRAKLVEYFDAPQPAVNQAIQAVYTMWRASFSALDPKIEAAEKDGFIVVRGRIENRGNASMEQAEAQLKATGCSLVSDSPFQQLGTISAGGSTATQQWKLKAEAPVCHLKLEVVAASPIPDLQYAAAETDIAASVKKETKTEQPGPDTPAGAEGFMTILRSELEVKFVSPKLAPSNKIPGINVMTDVFRGTKLTWEGVKFTFSGSAQLASSHRTNFPYMGSFPMPFASDWAPGSYKMIASGSIDPTGTLLRDITVHLEWKGKPIEPNYCWDLPDKFDHFNYTYTLKGIPLKGKGPIYANGGKDSGLIAYRYELSGDALKGKLGNLSYAQRWCLHPGESYDAVKINSAAESHKFALEIVFVKRK